MLRKRSRSHQKDQVMNNPMPDSISESYFHSDILNQRHKIGSFLKVSGLFVGFNPKNCDSDSVRSPTSPLDFRIFSSFGNPFRCSRSQNEGHSWDCSKVGLSIIDSLDDETNESGKDARSSDNKAIVFGRQMSVRSPTFGSNVRSLEKPQSLPKNVSVFPNAPNPIRTNNSDVVFEIGEAPVFEPEFSESLRARSMDSVRYGSHLTNFGNRKSRLGSGNLVPESKPNPIPLEWGLVGGSLKLDNSIVGSHSGNFFVGPIPACEIELSEDYTCVRTHGPNPKVTHIFGDCVLECHDDRLTDILVDDNATINAGSQCDDVLASSFPSEDFLKFCHSCQKKLDGEDIYMYRGEKAFCSYTCRSQEIEIDEVETD
ncbi:hypothetical protein ACS0TY_012350 [Phlomoides rotata]